MSAHRHKQWWNVERSMNTKEPIGMNYILGSITPWGHSKKPSFVVMDINPDTMIPVDVNTYSFDINHANEFNEPKWDKDYNLKKAFNLADLSPNSFNKFAISMGTNEKAA
jgi:hypothetical protein